MHLDLPALIDAYGYIAVAIGALLEGETVLALAGLAAHRGYLDLPIVIAVAALFGFAGDQLFFVLGRTHGARILARYPDAQRRAQQLDRLLARWHAPVIVLVRFMYGFRIMGPVMLGMSSVKHSTFALYNAIGALLWAPLVAGLGYLFGEAIEVLLHDVKDAEKWGLVLLLALAFMGFLLNKLHDRKLRGQAPESGSDP